MLKYVFRFFLLIGSVFALIALFGSLLPRSYDFTCEIDIAAPRERVFEELNRLQNWQRWSNWGSSEIPGLKVQVAGESGIGNAMTWTDSRGEGKLWITASQPVDFIEYQLRFGNFPDMFSRFELIEKSSDEIGSEQITHLKWKSSGKLPPGPFYGFWASSFAEHLQHEYHRSLEKLRARLESNDQ